MIEIIQIDYNTAKDFLLPRHYSGRIPSVSYAYGCYNNKELVGVLTVGKPASNSSQTIYWNKDGKGFVHEESDLTPVDSKYVEWFKSSAY